MVVSLVGEFMNIATSGLLCDCIGIDKVAPDDM